MRDVYPSEFRNEKKPHKTLCSLLYINVVKDLRKVLTKSICNNRIQVKVYA